MLPESWEALMHQRHRFSKKRKYNRRIQVWTRRVWGCTWLVLHLPLGYSQYTCLYHEIMIMSREERKLNRLNMNSRGATNEAPTCAVPMHAQQTGTRCRRGEKVSSAGEVRC